MTNDAEQKIFARLADLENEVDTLREGSGG